MSIHHGLTYGEYASGPGIRSGMVIDFIESPRLFKDRINGLAPRKGRSLLFGTSCHMAVLESKRYLAEHEITPELYPSAKGEDKPWTMAANYCKSWVAERESAGRLVVSRSDHARILLMQERMPSEVREIFSAGEPEVVVRNDLCGVGCQIRVDWLHLKDRRKYDFKTIRNIKAVDTSIHKYSYHIQDRYYTRVLKAETGEKFASRIVFAESEPPYRWRIVELDLDYCALADAAIDEALAGIKARNVTGCWDDPACITELVSPPSWLEVSDDMTDDEEAA